MSTDKVEFSEPTIESYQESLDNEKVDCDCNSCINIMMYESLRNTRKLEDIKFSTNYLQKFHTHIVDITTPELLSLYCGDFLTGNFLEFHNDNHANMSLCDMLSIRLEDIYKRFDMKMPERKQISSFSDYILNDDEEDQWCKFAMMRTCLAKEIKFSLYKELMSQNKELIDFLNNFNHLDITAPEILEKCFGDYTKKLEIWVTESLTRIWFRNLKYGSIENSEFVFKAKLSWIHRRIPDWSKSLDIGKEKVCVIQPESILENTV